MIAYIKGKISFRCPTYVLIETAGIGYQVHISLNTYGKLPVDGECLLHTYLHITEDAHALFGFATEEEKQVFLQLISVSGVGTSTARMILSSMLPADIRQAIITEQVALLESIKGIGPKTAKRMILDLKDKMSKGVALSPSTGGASFVSASQNNFRDEALIALGALGFNRSQSEAAVNKVLRQNPETKTVEELLKLSLKAI